MSRVIILLLDSFGIGAADDAAHYHDQGANTFGHILRACQQNQANQLSLREGELKIPHLARWGLIAAAKAATSEIFPTTKFDHVDIKARYGFAQEMSLGKDTPSGHWEIAGVPVLYEWGYFPPNYPSFPAELTEQFIAQTKIPGILGNCHASGTKIIDELGVEHLQTNKPIVYTSGDSVFQIAAHEKTFGLQRLYQLCEIARKLVDRYHIGRVIARPFLGDAGNFYRTANRRDYAIPPPASTLLDKLIADDGNVIAIGKTADIFAHRGISKTIKGEDNMALFDATLHALEHAVDRTIIFTNFVDFDSKYGHRRDVAGYAAALEAFDARLPELEKKLNEDDLVILTADHGCDPTWPGSDHTREFIPILMFGKKISPGFIGKRTTFADIGQTIADYLKIEKLAYGTSFL